MSVTNIVLAGLGGQGSVLATQVLGAAKDEAGALVRERVKKLFKRWRPPGDPSVPPPLTAEQLAQVRTHALLTASRLLPPHQAGLLADAIRGSLAGA